MPGSWTGTDLVPLVPVLDAIDDSAGLGFPAGYLGSPHAEQASPLTDRDKALLRLAQRAVMRGEQEITLDDALIARTCRRRPRRPGAADRRADRAGPCREHPRPGRRALHAARPGGVPRRRDGRPAGSCTCSTPPTGSGCATRTRPCPASTGTRCSPRSPPPRCTRGRRTSRRAPQAAGLLISLGEHRDASAAQQVPVSDLAVTADARRLHLVSVSRRRPVHTILPSAVDLTVHTHPLARFLLEAPVALAAPCTAFDWGAASALPFVPALRYGRTVLSPARWMLTAADLPGRDASWPRWDDALTAWASHAGLPGHVYAGDGDRCLALDLAEPSHRALLRAAARPRRAAPGSAPRPNPATWAGPAGTRTRSPSRSPRPALPSPRCGGAARSPGAATGTCPAATGGSTSSSTAPRDLQDAILTRHLPGLAARLGGQASWWFIRYDDPEPHLRLRLTLGAPELGPAAEARRHLDQRAPGRRADHPRELGDLLPGDRPVRRQPR